MEDKQVPNEEENKTASEEVQKEAPEEERPESAESELQQKKVICALSYVFGILFFLPLIFYPKDDFAKFHANQSLVILLTVIVGEALFGILSLIPVLNVVFGILCAVFGVVMLIYCIFGVVGVVREEKNELPVLGKIKLLK